MRNRRLILLVSLALTLASGGFASWVALAKAVKFANAEAASAYVSCPSPALGGHVPVAVFLPAGYATSGLAYPVVYFLHGLPAGPSLYKSSGFIAAAAAASGHGAIVVAIQGARSANSDREYLDWSSSENWPRAITHDVTTCIDARYRTIPTRTGRALVGLSAGGFGAFNIGLRSLATYAAVESWSGYFAATDPSGYHYLTFRSRSAAAAARIPSPSTLAASLHRYPSFLGFYVGSQDTRFLADNVALQKSWSHAHIPHWYEVYPGGHSLSLWSKEAPEWLGRALAYLSPPQSTGGVPVSG